MTDAIDAEAGPVLALCGGIGGAKLALGLYRVLDQDRLTVVVNTGDDFEHLGLHISPDLDTVLYTLAGCSNTETGWGRADETWTFMSVLSTLGGEDWFKLGDGDLALHIERTRRLKSGQSLSEISETFRRRLGVSARIVPMSDDPVQTVLHTADGPLAFQHYFVRDRCRHVIRRIGFEGAERARSNPLLMETLDDPNLRAVVICPSNPYLSVDPILALPKFREALEACAAPVVAVSPIVHGDAVKGPTAKIMRELGVPRNNAAIARHYGALIDGLVLDKADVAEIDAITIPALATSTVMMDLEDRINLAQAVLAFATRLDTRGKPGARADSGTGR